MASGRLGAAAPGAGRGRQVPVAAGPGALGVSRSPRRRPLTGVSVRQPERPASWTRRASPDVLYNPPRARVALCGCTSSSSAAAGSAPDWPWPCRATATRSPILDKNPRAFRRLSEAFTGQRLVGSGFDRDDLEAAGAVGADALAAVTSGDNTNILTVRIARENYGIARVVARIYDPRRAEIYQRLGHPDRGHRPLDDRPGPPEPRARPAWRPSGSTPPPSWSSSSGACPRTGPAGRSPTSRSTGSVKLVAVVRAGDPRLDIRELVGQEGDVLHIAAAKDALDLLGRAARARAAAVAARQGLGGEGRHLRRPAASAPRSPAT